MSAPRPPAVAGTFYPGEPQALRQTIASLNDAADHPVGPPPRAVVAPHAGYVYSGAVAARAYRELAARRATITRVIVLGPAHRLPVRGIGTSGARGFVTPLGEVPVDHAASAALEALPGIARADAAHAPEHSIEVQLPFLQCALDAFAVLPLLVGDATPEAVRDAIAPFWDDPASIIVVSTDLSHYLDYDAAVRRDALTDAAIRRCTPQDIGPEDACGCRPLGGALLLARERRATVRRLALCNSGDTAGPRDRVVGYAAYAIH